MSNPEEPPSGRTEAKKKKADEESDEVVPREIDIHFQMYGKHAWEVEYGERCPTCNKRIDEFGYCACGGSI
jgi:hypothetical protein